MKISILNKVILLASGLLLSFLKMGKPVLPHKTFMNLLPGLLLVMTAAFVAGFNLA